MQASSVTISNSQLENNTQTIPPIKIDANYLVTGTYKFKLSI